MKFSSVTRKMEVQVMANNMEDIGQEYGNKITEREKANMGYM